MTKQEIARLIMNTQYNYPKSYADFLNTEYGILYFNENNPFSNDSNHAVITISGDKSDYGKIVENIKEFYMSKKIPPCIYSNYIPGQLDEIKDSLIKCSFTFYVFNNSYLIHTGECKISIPCSLTIRRIEKNDDFSFIHKIWGASENKSSGANRVYNIAINRKDWTNYNLFVGYLDDGTPVTAAAVEYIGGVGMVDDV